MAQTLTALPVPRAGSHPAIDPGAVERLRRQLGRPDPVDPPVERSVGRSSIGDGPTGHGEGDQCASTRAAEPATLSGRLRALATRAGAPLVTRMRDELARAAASEQAALHDEIDGLRTELERTRAEHAAELAVLHEQVRGRR